MDVISHIDHSGTEPRIQTNDNHQKGVAQLAELYASEFGMGEWGRVMGLLHDKGKERSAFQSYIRKQTGYEIDNVYPYDDKSHAFVGALLSRKLYGSLSAPIGNSIDGHYAGLYDTCALKGQRVPSPGQRPG